MSMSRDPETGLTPLAKQICIESIKTPADLTGAAQRARIAVVGEPYAKNQTAVSTASQVLSRINSRRYIAQLAHRANATPLKALERVGKALDAQRTIMSPTGKDSVTEDDYGVQLRAADMVFKIHGLYQAPESQGGDAAQVIDIEIEDAGMLIGE